jgi:1-acyl-sn-glycerol-3-phosphate acyltransferase
MAMRAERLHERPGFWVSAARWIVSGANSFAHLVPLLVVSPFSRGRAWVIYRHWARTMCRIFGIVPVLRDDNEGGDSSPAPCVYVWLNQTSLSEVPAFASLLPPWHTIANLEYAIMPLFGWAMLPLRNIVIIRQWKWQAKRGIERAAARLARGERWLVSIEGARSLDGELQPYKKGPIVMALRSRATIVPLAVRGARDVMPRGDWRLRPGPIEVHLLRAIPTQGLTFEDREAIVARLRRMAERELAHR